MKLNKKLLIFVLSLCLLVGVFALAAFAAEGDAAVLTIRYQDGTVQTYEEGEEIVAPAVPRIFLVYDEEGRAYKYTTELGATWQGLPRAATAELLGTTLESTVAGTRDERQVYYVTEETLDGVTTVVYHMNNDVHKYLSNSNAGDKGDGTNTGAASFAQIYPEANTAFKSSLKIILYADVEASSFATKMFLDSARRSAIVANLDLNGHTVINKSSSFMDVTGLSLRIYSSVPGAHWYQTSASAIARANDDAYVYLGDTSSGGKNAANISFHCKAISAQQYGSGMYVYGGKFYQTGSGAFFDFSRRINAICNAEFYLTAGSTMFADSYGYDGTVVAKGSSSITNCKFYSPEASGLVSASSSSAKPVFDNCVFINVKVDKNQGAAVLNFRSNCVSSLGSADTYGSESLVFAKIAPKAYEGSLTAEDGSPISATINFVMKDAGDTLCITTEQGSAYYALGAPFSSDAGDGVKIENGKLYSVPKYDLSEVYQIEDGVVTATGKVTVKLIYMVEDIPAFSYRDTVTGKLYAAGYNVDCGGTAEGVFEKFYEIFSVPAAAYEITMYMDMNVTKLLAFGKFVTYRPLNSKGEAENRDYYNSLPAGSITWDLNGHTITVDSACTTMDMNAYNGSGVKCVIGLEKSSNTLTIKSSKPGARFINNSSSVLFGVAEAAGAKISILGENLVVESKGAIYYGSNAGNGVKHFSIDGGLYIYNGTSYAIGFSGKGDFVKNATVICTQKVAKVFGYDKYRNEVLTIENCILIAQENSPLFGGNSSNGSNFNGSSATVKDCVLIGIAPVLKLVSTEEVAVVYEGVNAFSTEENLAALYAEAPEGLAKYLFEVGVLNAEGEIEVVSVYGYASADQILAVTYASDLVKYYIVGKYFVPIEMTSDYYTVTFDLASGKANIPVAWAGVPAEGIVAEAGEITATPAENFVSIIFALYDTETQAVVAFETANAANIGIALADALNNAANAGTLYVYGDITVGALSVEKALEILLGEYSLTLGASMAVSAPLTVQGGEILTAAKAPFALSGSAAVVLNGTSLYLSDASVIFGGSEGSVALNDVVIFNLGDASLVNGIAATVNGAKLMGVSLGATVTVDGTVLGTAGTFAGCSFANGVINGVKVNNFVESVEVLGTVYAIAYAEAATDDEALVVNVTYRYDGVNRASEKYYYGSIASFYSLFAEGYYFSYQGVDILTEDVVVNCLFTADASKLQAKLVLADSLAFTFYLQVEADGVLANLKLGGVAIDFAALDIETIGGVQYYVIPVSFASFADVLDDMVLTVDLVNADTYMTITATAALDAYFAEILEAGDASAAARAYAVMDYVCTLAQYFDYSFGYGDARGVNLGRLFNMLANYEELKSDAALPTANEALSSAYIENVLLVAKEKITFAFRIADDFEGKILVNGVEQAVSQPFAGFDRDYVLAEVALADLDEVITVTVQSEAGETLETFNYTLADYVAGVAVQNEGVTAAYAKALWNLAAALG